MHFLNSMPSCLWKPLTNLSTTRRPAALTADRMWWAQEVMAKERKGAGGPPMGKLNNVLMQMRKNCNHPDLISGAYDGSLTYPSADELVAQVRAGPLCALSNTSMPSGS